MSSALVPQSRVLPISRLSLILVLAAGLASCAGVEELPPDAKGPIIYARLCQKCHGATGRGDGPQAQWKYLPPANFHDPRVRAKSDEQLLAVISQGRFLTPMHSYRGTLSDDQMREVVAHIRQLSAPAK